MNYYNEWDPEIAAQLQGLIDAKLIPHGHIDTRSISEVRAADLTGYTQCHFFAGIGGWSEALRLANWPETRPCWTGSCPCQPYSVAGGRLGERDERDLWPEFFRLISECRPSVVFGEQVENAIRHGWLDRVRTDLEGEGYACGDTVLGAHSIGAPHIRLRLYWMAYAVKDGRRAWCGIQRGSLETGSAHGDHTERCGGAGALANAPGNGWQQEHKDASGSRCGGAAKGRPAGSGLCSTASGVVQPIGEGLEGHAGNGDRGDESGRFIADATGSTAAAGHWSAFRWIECRDGKLRRIPAEPALFPLVDGVSYKLARCRSARPPIISGAGNAIVPPLAAEFIKAGYEFF